MKFPRLFRKPPKPITVEDHKRPLSPDIDHTIDRRLYYRPTPPGITCHRCRQPLIQESTAYLLVTFNDAGQETDRFMVGGDFGYYCRNCPIIVIDPADLEPYRETVSTQFDSGEGFAVLGRVALEGFTEEENNIPVGELDSIPIVPFYSPSPTKPKNKRRKKRKGR